LLTEVGLLEKCSQLLQDNAKTLEKHFKDCDPRTVIKALQDDFTLSAVLLCRAFISNMLSDYSFLVASDCMKTLLLCEQLSSRITDFKEFPTHAKYLDTIRRKYKGERRLWIKFDVAKGKMEKK
jgi:hypothetical protein